MEQSQLIPFDPKPDDVIVVDRHDFSLKCVELPTRRDVVYNRLLSNCKPQLKRAEGKHAIDRMASEIVDTIVRVHKGRFLRLVSAGPDKKGLCTVLSPFACHEKVSVALRRMHSRLKLNPSGKRRPTAPPSKKETGDGKAKLPGRFAFREDFEGTEDGEHSPDSSDDEDESVQDSKEEMEQDDATVRTTESPGQNKIIPFDPKPNDVIATKNRGWHTTHPGNLKYRELLQEYSPQFLQQSDEAKSHAHSTVSEKIVDKIFQRNGRFLKWHSVELPDPGSCIVMSRSDCSRKVQKALRSFRGAVVSHELDKTRKPTSPVKFSSKLSVSKSTHATLKGVPKSTQKQGDSNLTNLPKSAQKPNVVPKVKAEHHKHSGNSFVSTPNNTGPWTVERLYETTSAVQANNYHLYGTPQDETAMRKWLNDNKLPQSVGDYLLGFGARTIDDVVLMVEVRSDDLKGLPLLDFHKLTNAVQSRRDEVEDDPIYYV